MLKMPGVVVPVITPVALFRLTPAGRVWPTGTLAKKVKGGVPFVTVSAGLLNAIPVHFVTAWHVRVIAPGAGGGSAGAGGGAGAAGAAGAWLVTLWDGTRIVCASVWFSEITKAKISDPRRRKIGVFMYSDPRFPTENALNEAIPHTGASADSFRPVV
jgi:hypothetical protein